MNQSIQDLNGSNVSRLLRQIKEITQDELYEEMTELKTRVLGLLKDYQSSLQQKENIRQLNQQIRRDVGQISNDYSCIVDKLNQSVDCTFQSIDSIGPFQRQEKVSLPSQQEMNKMFNLVEEFLEKFQGKKAKHNLYSSFISDKMERSGISFADTSIIDVNSRISIIKDQISSNLQDKKYSQKIILETVDALQEALSVHKIENIKSIIKRIEYYMAQCQHDTTDLYQMLQRAVDSCKEKESELENQSIIEDKDLKRKFFDIALQIKSDLPTTHPGRKMLVSVLFEQAQHLDENQWQDWIIEQLNKQT